MKNLDDVLSWGAAIAIALGLCFLFVGDPNLWTLLHAKAIAAASAKP